MVETLTLVSAFPTIVDASFGGAITGQALIHMPQTGTLQHPKIQTRATAETMLVAFKAMM